MRRSERGVTLTEILIILALLAMLSLISIPSLLRMLRTFEVRGVTSSLAAGLRRTQGLALKEHRNFIFVANPVENSTSPNFCWATPGRASYAIVEDPGADCKVAVCPSITGERVREWGPPVPRMVSFAAQPASQEPLDIGGASGSDVFATICFTSRGYVHTATGTRTGVYVGDTHHKIYGRVTTNLTGRVSVQRYIGGSYVEQ